MVSDAKAREEGERLSDIEEALKMANVKRDRIDIALDMAAYEKKHGEKALDCLIRFIRERDAGKMTADIAATVYHDLYGGGKCFLPRTLHYGETAVESIERSKKQFADS